MVLYVFRTIPKGKEIVSDPFLQFLESDTFFSLYHDLSLIHLYLSTMILKIGSGALNGKMLLVRILEGCLF